MSLSSLLYPRILKGQHKNDSCIHVTSSLLVNGFGGASVYSRRWPNVGDVILKITWYTFGTVLVKSVPKLYQNCTYVAVMMLQVWCNSVPKVYQKCTYVAEMMLQFWCSFWEKCTKSVLMLQFWCNFRQNCTKRVLMLQFWYSFGTLFPQTAPKLQHPYSNTSAILVQFWYSFGQKCTKSVLDRSMLPTLIAALVGTIRSLTFPIWI